MKIPSDIIDYMDNWSVGFNYGYREAIKGFQYATNFRYEKYGFMTGYLQGYVCGVEKEKGWNSSQEVLSEIINLHKIGRIINES